MSQKLNPLNSSLRRYHVGQLYKKNNVRIVAGERWYNMDMRSCTICIHLNRSDIDAAIVNGTPYRDIAGRFQVSKTAVARHADGHVAESIHKSKEALEEVMALDVAHELTWCNQSAHQIYDAALSGEKPDPRTAITALGEVRKQAELWAELQGELDRVTTIELVEHPDWINLREIIFAALTPWPDAQVAVARAILAA